MPTKQVGKRNPANWDAHARIDVYTFIKVISWLGCGRVCCLSWSWTVDLLSTVKVEKS